MKKISVFNHITVDGYFAGPEGEIDWFKAIQPDHEWDTFTHNRAAGGSTLMFGRTTYEMMKNFWPTHEAMKADPEIARIMNNSPKIVISKSLRKVEEGPDWKNIRLFHDISPEEILGLKQKEDIVIMGSGTIVQQLANLNLIDEYSLAVVPIILGTGKALFGGVKTMNLKLIEARPFRNGILFLRYQSAS